MRRLSYEEKKVILAHDFGGSFPRLHNPTLVGLFVRTACHHRNAFESNPFLPWSETQRKKTGLALTNSLLGPVCDNLKVSHDALLKKG